MDFTVIKHTDKIEPYRLSNFIRIGISICAFCYLFSICLNQWSFISFLYTMLAFYWITNMDSTMRRVHFELMRHKDGKKYQNLLKLTFSNPKIRFYYKLLYLVVFILILKVVGSFVGSMNYLRLSDKKDFRIQLMMDLEVSIEENTFTFKTLLFNLYPECLMITFIIIILFLEHSVVPYTKESIISIVDTFGTKSSNFTKIVQCICIFTLPILAKSPLTILPLLGLVVALLIIFYKMKSYKAVLWIPEIFLMTSVLAFMFFKVRTVGLNMGIEKIANYICNYGESKEAVILNDK